jgi:hypothetical protein
VVVNLRKKGNASRRMLWRAAGLGTTLRPRERNLGGMAAGHLLRLVANGAAPRLALAWLPLMKCGEQPGMIKRWLDLAIQESNPAHRRELKLAEVFAEAAGCREVWRDALKEWDKMESQVLKEWTAEAERKAVREPLLRVVEARFGKPSSALLEAIQAAEEVAQLQKWLLVAATAPSLEEVQLAVFGGRR